jgi:hypothetical protein
VQRPDALAERGEPGDVVALQGVATDEEPVCGGVEGDMPERVAGDVDDAQRDAARVDLIPIRERPIHAVGLDRLVLPSRRTRLWVPTVHAHCLPTMGGDGDTVAPLQAAVAADVVGVVVGVDKKREPSGRAARRAQQPLGLREVAAETAVHQDRLLAAHQRHVRAWEGALDEDEPRGMGHHGASPSIGQSAIACERVGRHRGREGGGRRRTAR